MLTPKNSENYVETITNLNYVDFRVVPHAMHDYKSNVAYQRGRAIKCLTDKGAEDAFKVTKFRGECTRLHLELACMGEGSLESAAGGNSETYNQLA